MSVIQNAKQPVDNFNEARDVFQCFQRASQAISAQEVPARLLHLIDLRVSQINGCAFCIKMHLEEARESGETRERLDSLSVWRHTEFFSDEERAALAWAEALSALNPQQSYGPLRADLRAHFSEADIATLTAAIAQINLWNRVQISGHA